MSTVLEHCRMSGGGAAARWGSGGGKDAIRTHIHSALKFNSNLFSFHMKNLIFVPRARGSLELQNTSNHLRPTHRLSPPDNRHLALSHTYTYMNAHITATHAIAMHLTFTQLSLLHAHRTDRHFSARHYSYLAAPSSLAAHCIALSIKHLLSIKNLFRAAHISVILTTSAFNLSLLLRSIHSSERTLCEDAKKRDDCGRIDRVFQCANGCVLFLVVRCPRTVIIMITLLAQLLISRSRETILAPKFGVCGARVCSYCLHMGFCTHNVCT